MDGNDGLPDLNGPAAFFYGRVFVSLSRETLFGYL